MVATEERLKILRMVQEGKISAEQAVQILEVLETSDATAAKKTNTQGSAYPVSPGYSGKGPRWFRVRVTDTDSGKPRVNVRLPIGLVSSGLKMGSKFVPEIEGMDMAVLVEAIQSGEMGQIVDVYDEEDGEHVEVFIE